MGKLYEKLYALLRVQPIDNQFVIERTMIRSLGLAVTILNVLSPLK